MDHQSETRPLLYRRQSRFSRQPSPERVGKRRYNPSQSSSTGDGVGGGGGGGDQSHLRTVINLVNILVGIGLLSLPLAFRYVGWILGFVLLTLVAVATAYSARCLAQCMDGADQLQSYLDIAGAAFGPRAQLFTTALFSLNILAAGIASVIIFGETMAILVPSVSAIVWKIICGLIVLPLQFFNLRIMAHVSVLGLFSCLGLVLLIVTAGFVKPSTPGSLREPAPTNLFPSDVLGSFASIGLFMAPWAAAASVPTFYRDMHSPKSYRSCITQSYSISYAIFAVMGIAGYLMFGPGTDQAIIYNILSFSPRGYPHALLFWLVALTALMPITKITLSLRPLMDMLDDIARDDNSEQNTSRDHTYGYGTTKSDDDSNSRIQAHPTQIDPQTNDLAANDDQPQQQQQQQPNNPRIQTRILIRILVTTTLVLTSILVPSFDKIIGIMGSALCCTISVILPVAFHLRLCGHQISRLRRWFSYAMLILGMGMAGLGTVGVVLA